MKQSIIPTKRKSQPKVIALSGGVGGAKLVTGLASILPTDDLLTFANTADDFNHLGLKICPDLDSIMYALANINDRKRGWGISNESWNFLGALKKLNSETWFQLGDKDLATHVQRSHLLNQGASLSETTHQLTSALGIKHRLLPMSDDPVQTRLQTNEGELDFQTYFVARQCAPIVQRIFFSGIEQAKPHPHLVSALDIENTDTQALIICPSNPFVSVDPILNLSNIAEQLTSSPMHKVAVSPLIAGKALKGPAAKMMQELNLPCNAYGIALYYQTYLKDKSKQSLLSHFVIDKTDASLEPSIAELGVKVIVCNTIMHSRAQQVQLAKTIVQELKITIND